MTLYGAIYHPPARFGPGPYPTIVSVYGGPHVQWWSNSWRMTAAHARPVPAPPGLPGVHRSTTAAAPGAGWPSKAPSATTWATLEVEDQVDGVRWLVQQGLADPQRVGIYGWSYGGLHVRDVPGARPGDLPAPPSPARR